jgi:hypothetical protein
VYARLEHLVGGSTCAVVKYKLSGLDDFIILFSLTTLRKVNRCSAAQVACAAGQAARMHGTGLMLHAHRC